MKISLEIDVPEFDWIDTPTLYRTPLVSLTTSKKLKKLVA